MQLFLPACSLSFHSVNVVLCKQKYLILMNPNLSIFPFMDHDFAVNNKLCLKFFPKLPFPRNFSCSLSFIVFHFTFKLIHFELIFVRCDSPQGSLYCSGCQIAPSLLAEIGIFPLLNCFCTVKKKISGEDFCISISGFYILFI